MWRDYATSYIKNNRTSSKSIIIAAFVATLFLSMLCTLFFNFWKYDVEKIILEEGNWQGRIIADITEEDFVTVQNFNNVKSAIVSKNLSIEGNKVVDIVFQDMRKTYQTMSLIADSIGLKEEALVYHIELLSNFMIYNPQDNQPPLLLVFYLIILVIISLSLILIIHNSFAMSMNSRIHQFGILSSIGATPSQIRICLLHEAIYLCLIPILFASLVGIFFSFGIIQLLNSVGVGVIDRHEAIFGYHPLVFVVTILSAFTTIFCSVWYPARKISKMEPLEAVKNENKIIVVKKRKVSILKILFGIEGELAGIALYTQKKALRTSTLSLTLSFLCFTMMICFLTLSTLSTRETYFERYQDVWDVMLTVKNTNIENVELKENISNIYDIAIYQKATAKISINDDWQSNELAALGGVGKVSGSLVPKQEGSWIVKAPIIIMDNRSFRNYCLQLGIAYDFDGTIILNRIWNSANSNFREKKYVPFINTDKKKVELYLLDNEEKKVEISVLAYTQKPPVLREEYDNYALVQFIPLSLWEKITENRETDSYIRVLAAKEIGLSELDELENSILQIFKPKYEIESENRIREKLANDNMIQGFMLILSGFCSLIAFIGIANVFSNTLSFIQHRRREFAQYISIGLTPKEMKKMFFIEALVIAGRPILITVPLTAIFISFAVKASYLNLTKFLREIPAIPIALFSGSIFIFIFFAYFVGGKKVLKSNLIELLNNDAMV